MKYYYSGELKVSNALKEDVLNAAEQIFECGYSLSWEKNESSLLLEFNDSQFSDHEIYDFVEEAEKHNWIVTGTVQYSGDDDGAYMVSNNHVDQVSKESFTLMNVSDDLLLAELEHRGYLVVKEIKKVQTKTPIGTLIAEQASDPEHPGLWISIAEDGADGKRRIEHGICLIEFCDAEYNKCCAKDESGDNIKLRFYRQQEDTLIREEPDEPIIYRKIKEEKRHE